MENSVRFIPIFFSLSLFVELSILLEKIERVLNRIYLREGVELIQLGFKNEIEEGCEQRCHSIRELKNNLE